MVRVAPRGAAPRGFLEPRTSVSFSFRADDLGAGRGARWPQETGHALLQRVTGRRFLPPLPPERSMVSPPPPPPSCAASATSTTRSAMAKNAFEASPVGDA